VANQPGRGPDRSGQRRRRPRTPSSAPTPIDPLEAIRAASLPVGLGASAWLESPWWLAAALAYNIAGGPVHDFLATVLGAAADRLGDRIRHGRPAQAPADPQLVVAQPAPKALASPDSTRPAPARFPVGNGRARVQRRRPERGGDRAGGQATQADSQQPEER
jgi:hypothetical protein